MNIHILKHIDFENEAYIGDWALKNGHFISGTNLYLGETCPGIDSFDLLAVMGGPMNIYQEKKYHFLKAEKKFIEKAIGENKIVLGICLGAQLIADVLGGKVSRNDEKEIGWYDVEILKEPYAAKQRKEGVFTGFPEKFTALHWHGDTFSIPPGAKHIAVSKACKNQAFIYNDKVAGLQFHLESTPLSLSRLIQNCGYEIVKGKYIQESGDMLECNENFIKSNMLMKKILDNLIRLV